jgi:hypothetical protein
MDYITLANTFNGGVFAIYFAIISMISMPFLVGFLTNCVQPRQVRFHFEPNVSTTSESISEDMLGLVMDMDLEGMEDYDQPLYVYSMEEVPDHAMDDSFWYDNVSQEELDQAMGTGNWVKKSVLFTGQHHELDENVNCAAQQDKYGKYEKAMDLARTLKNQIKADPVRCFVSQLLQQSDKQVVMQMVEDFGLRASIFGSDNWHHGKTVVQIRRKARLAA